jgi:hypothetical protein
MSAIFKFILALWVIFALFAIFNDGGTPIRTAEKNTQKILSKTLNAVADQADNIREQAESAKESIINLKHPQKEMAGARPEIHKENSSPRR